VSKGAEVVLLKNNEMSDGPCQALEYNIIELQKIPHDKQARSHSEGVKDPTVNFNLSWSTFSSRTSEKLRYEPSRWSKPIVMSLVIGSIACMR
jgi:hypothetical protein